MAKAKEESTAVSLFGDKTGALPAHLQTDAPAGNENVTSEDMATPRLNLLQQLSPECQTVDGAKPGMLYNTVTGELYDTVNLINLFFRKQYAVFKIRAKGQGFEGNFSTQAEAAAHMATLDSPNDWNIVDTDQHYCLLLDEEGNGVSPVLIYMSASKLRVSKDWNTEIQLKGPQADRFAGVWNLSSVTEKNGAGQPYENLKVEFMGWAPEDLYAAAKDAYQGFKTPIKEAA